MVRSTDSPDMTIAVDRGRKTLNQANEAKKAQNSFVTTHVNRTFAFRCLSSFSNHS